jgi:hypothetical protein
MTQKSALRVVGGFAGAAFALLGVWAIVSGPWPIGVELVIFGALLVAGSTFERWKYRPRIARDQAGWASTDETFYDPISGERMTVMYNARTGERDYRATS